LRLCAKNIRKNINKRRIVVFWAYFGSENGKSDPAITNNKKYIRDHYLLTCSWVYVLKKWGKTPKKMGFFEFWGCSREKMANLTPPLKRMEKYTQKIINWKFAKNYLHNLYILWTRCRWRMLRFDKNGKKILSRWGYYITFSESKIVGQKIGTDYPS
jgi:hypothetical protein